MRRLASAPVEVAVELIRRQAFEKSDLQDLLLWLGKHRGTDTIKMGRLQLAANDLLTFGPWINSEAGFIPALAYADRQICIHAVINAKLSDEELTRLAALLNLQTDGHLLRQARVAVELEQERRRHGFTRTGRNSVTSERRTNARR
jgi:hypothetical protein